MDAVTAHLHHPAGPLHPGVEVRGDGLVVGLLTADRTALLRLEGVLDATTGPVLMAVGRALATRGSEHVVLDCAGLGLCDAAGLHVLSALRDLPGTASLMLVRADPTLRDLVVGTGLDICVVAGGGVPVEPAPG